MANDAHDGGKKPETSQPKDMKALFPGHYKLSDEEFRALWSDAVFVFDANVLLNFYRYSVATRQSFLRVIKKIRSRIWLPHQAALEFQRNRISVIAKQTESYEEARKQAEQILEKLKAPTKHPFVSEATLQRTEDALVSLIAELQDRQNEHEKLLQEDSGLLEITEIFSTSIGSEPAPDVFKQHCELAAKRMEGKTPPGYKDRDKESGRDIGDVILWLQTLDFATKLKKPIILVTDDAKEDWWLSARGRIIGPRPELVKEFFDRTGKRFYMYQPGRFVDFAGKYLDEKSDPAVIEEVRRFTDERALKRQNEEWLRQRAREANLPPEATELLNIGLHATTHAPDIEAFVQTVNSVDVATWSRLKHPMMMDADLRTKLEGIVNHCPCVVSIAEQIANIPPPSFHAYSDQLEKTMPQQCALLVQLRRLPDEAIRLASWMRDHERSARARASPKGP